MKSHAVWLLAIGWYATGLITGQVSRWYWLWGLQAYALAFALSLVAWGLLGLFQWQYGSNDRTLHSYFFDGDSTWIKRFVAVILLLYGAMLWLVWTRQGGPLPPGVMMPGDIAAAIRGNDAWMARWKVLFHYSPQIIQGPIAEEFLFRGLLLTYLKQRCDRRIAWGVTTVLFVMSHDIYGRGEEYLLSQGAKLLVAGTILLAVAERARSLLPAILLHALNNLLQAVVEFRRAFPA